MFCKNCGKELPDSAKFCSGCGTPVISEVTAPGVEPPQPPVEETPVSPAPPAEEVPVPSASPTEDLTAPVVPVQPDAPQGEERVPAPVTKRRGVSGMVVIGLGAVAAIVVIVLLVKLFSGMGGGGKRGQAFAYLNDDAELMYLADLKEKTEPIEVTDEADSNTRVQFTADGKTMYFRDSRNALYKIAVSELKKDGRPERVSRDVTSFTVLKTGNVLYTKDGSRGTELNCYTGKEDFRITKAFSTYELSEDHKTVYYTELDEDDSTLTLYKSALKKDAQAEELLDGATTIYTDFDSSVLVYGEGELDVLDDNLAYANDTDWNTVTVYSCKPGGEPTELVKDICAINGLTVDGDKVSFYYMIEDLEECSLYDLVSDAQQSSDAAVTAQELVRPSWYDEYYPSEFYVEGNTVYFKDSQGNSFPIDTSELQASTGRPATELYTWEVRPIAEANARERYNAAMEEYNSKYESWSAANSRNQMRESLKNESYIQRSYSIYHYNNAPADTPIATGVSVSQGTAAPDQGIFLYKKANTSEGKVCDLADLSYYREVYDYLSKGSEDAPWYQNVGGTESVLELDDETHINGLYILNGKEAVLELSEDSEYWLDAYSIGKTALTFANTVIDDEYTGLELATDAKGNDVLYYFTDTESENYGTLGDFNRYSGGEPEVLAKEVYAVRILDEDDAIYVATDRDRNGEELSLLQGDKPTVINDELDGNVLIFLDSKQLLYTADGDLYLWNGKEERRVAKDVMRVWANDKMSYTTYSAY